MKQHNNLAYSLQLFCASVAFIFATPKESFG